jgi:hypothetical protein
MKNRQSHLQDTMCTYVTPVCACFPYLPALAAALLCRHWVAFYQLGDEIKPSLFSPLYLTQPKLLPHVLVHSFLQQPPLTRQPLCITAMVGIMTLHPWAVIYCCHHLLVKSACRIYHTTSISYLFAHI